MESTKEQIGLSIMDVLQRISFVVVAGLLILTAYGNGEVLFWTSTVAAFLLFVWLFVDRKIWLACVTAIAFLVVVLLNPHPLY